MFMRKALSLCIMVAAAAEARDALELRDYYLINSADEPSISRDGDLVAVSRHYIDEADNARKSFATQLGAAVGGISIPKTCLPASTMCAPTTRSTRRVWVSPATRMAAS